MALSDVFGKGSSFYDLSEAEKRNLRQALSLEIKRREERTKLEQVREIVPIEEWLESEFYLGENCHSIYDYWKDLMKEIFDSKRGERDRINELIISGCFTGDTKVSLLDGRELSMLDIVSEYGLNKPFWVYSCDSKGNIVPGKASCARKTGVNRELVKVTLDNGEEIKCTPDHRFMMRDGSYRKAEDLKVEDSLMSFNSSNKVLKVEHLSETEDVYDFEVDKYHNFALSSGVFVHNSLGVGKSTVAVLILLRKFYELSCYRNINNMFGLMSTSSIVFLYFSVSKYQANLTGFGDMISFLDSIPYFKEYFPRNLGINSLILLPENLMVTYGSGTQHSIGMNLLGSILDEANFFKGRAGEEENATNKVAELYTSIINRSRSRFVQDGGIDHSISILVSSSTHASSFTEQRISQVEGNKNVIVKSPNLWEVKPKNYSGRKFWVFQGTHNFEPFVVNSIDDLNNYRVSEGMGRWDKKVDLEDGQEGDVVITKAIEDLPEDRKEYFLNVPIEMKSSFDGNIIQSLQDLGGVSVAPVGKLFTAVDIFNKNCIAGLEHPFVSDSLVISTGDKIRVSDYLKPDFVFKDKHKPRYIHLDQSAVTDSTGISCVHVSNILDFDGVKKPLIEIDFMLQINPPKPPKRIAIYKLRDFVSSLKTLYGLKIGRISYDIWGSEESRQILSEMGINTAYVSVDRNDKAYLDLITILYDMRLRMYSYEPFRKELFNLIHLRHRRKVEHPRENNDGSVGSKDVADSLVGAIQGVLTSDFTDAYYDGIGDFFIANQGKRIIPENYDLNESTERLIDKIIEAEMEDIINSF